MRNPFRYFNSSPEVIRLAVMMYIRYSHVSGLYMLAHDEHWQPTGAALAGGWLASFPNVPESIELELVDCLTHSGALATLASIAATRANTVFRNLDHMLAWLAIDVLVRFDAVRPDLAGIGARNPEFIWFLRNRLQLERRGSMLLLTPAQAKWIVSEFRTQWPYALLQGSGWGDTKPNDATDFLRALISRIADDTTVEASDAMQALIAEPVDSYSELIRHMAAEQRQKRAEEDFAPLLPKSLGELLTEGPPSNADDLKSLIVEELAVAQKKLVGDDLDQIRDFWDDAGVPYGENLNGCRSPLTHLTKRREVSPKSSDSLNLDKLLLMARKTWCFILRNFVEAPSARSTEALRCLIEASAFSTLVRQRPPTPSCRGHSPYCGENSEPGRRIKGELDIQHPS
jgi:hypothetical protein